MRPTRLLLFAPALLLMACLATPARADQKDVLRDETSTFPLDGARALRLDVPVGEVHVDAVAGDRVEAHLKLSCRAHSWRCPERAAALRLVPDHSGDTLTLKVQGYDREDKRGINHPDLELWITAPAQLEVAVDMGVGELHLAGIEGDVTVDLGVGEARVAVPESTVKSVSIDVGVGEARLSPNQVETHHHGFLFLGNEVDWKSGIGRSRVAVDVGVGEASVRLEQPQ